MTQQTNKQSVLTAIKPRRQPNHFAAGGQNPPGGSSGKPLRKGCELQGVDSGTLMQALRLCATPQCSTLVESGHCPAHTRQRDRQRYNAATRKWYATKAWHTLRQLVLAAQPVCQTCHLAPSTEVDHIIPHRGNFAMFYEQSNLQGLCGTCHRRKTQAGA